MSVSENQAVIRRYFKDVWENRNPDLIEDLFSPDFVNHAAAPGLPPGPAGLKANYENTSTAFPDVRFTIEEMFSSQDPDRVIIRYVMHGTHDGVFQGIPPTGRTVSVKGIGIYRVENGKIAEGWVLRDSLGLLSQLGAEVKHKED